MGAKCREMTAEDRCKLHQERSKPIIEAIFQRLEKLKALTLSSEPLRKAIDYALNQRGTLYRYPDDGRITTRLKMPFALLRLAERIGCLRAVERGARATALFLGLTQSCKACGVNPWQYFDDMLRRIMSHPINRLAELLPDQWQPMTRDENGLIE